MSILKRTIIMTVCTALVLFSLVYFISNIIYMRGFTDLERNTVGKNTRQVTDALTVRLKTLDSFCSDWSSWDDTYEFVLGNNPEYVDRNLMDATFINSDFDLFAVIDTKGEIYYSQAYDIANQQETVVPEDLPDVITAEGLNRPLGILSDISGIITLSGQPMLVVCNPILTSLSQGPSAGSLLVGRFLDSREILNLSVTTGLSVDLLLPQDTSRAQELKSVMPSLNAPDSIFVNVLNSDSIAGYTLVNDLNGQPAFLFKVTVPRDISSEGKKTVTYLQFTVLGIGIVFCVVFVLLTRKLILDRVTSLSHAVNAIGSKGNMSSRVTMDGKDELSILANNINGMLASLQKSESTRQSQQELIGHIIANTPNAILAIDSSNNITLVNDAFRRMFGLTNVAMPYRKVDDIPGLALLVPEIKAFKESHKNMAKKELHYTNGTTKTLIASFARLKEEEVYFLYLTDITEERARQESLYLTDRLASIGEMASGVAHELNNPLTSIIGLSEIVAKESTEENIKEDMGIIKSESQRAAGIVRNLLSFARKNTALKQSTSINKILQDVLKLRSYEHNVNDITVVRELDPQLPDITADSAQIQQVFINIILNAEQAMVQAHHRGTLKIKTEKLADNIRISFADDGPGIEPQNLRRIFDPFFTTKEVGKGTGLGLSISFGIITEHGGTIYATSENGKGATFIIELPLKSVDEKEKKEYA